MRLRFSVLVTILLLMPVLVDDASAIEVKEVLNANTLVLNSGEQVRLAGILTPQQEMIEIAKHQLQELIDGRDVTIVSTSNKPDRYQRRVALVYDSQHRLLQQELIAEGNAMVMYFEDDIDAELPLLQMHEQKARQARKGIWSDGKHQIISADDKHHFINQFKIVEACVVSVHESRQNLYVNFSNEWKGHFYLFVARKDRKKLDTTWLKKLEGKMIHVRGWIEYHHAPSITVQHSAQIEIMS